MGRVVVCGAGGFIGHHLVRRLKREGHHVVGVDRAPPEFPCAADRFLLGDLREPATARAAIDGPGIEVYQLAADMGGAGYVFTGEHDAAIMANSCRINLNVLEACRDARVLRVLFASSACVYPARNQADPDRPDCAEDTAYPAEPDSEYGWEKLFAERLYAAFARNHGLQVRIARLHNVFGPEGTWRGGREKAVAAVCRKVAEAPDGGEVELWGDGRQTRSFLYVDDCVEGLLRLMRSPFAGPVNLGSDEAVRIDELARLVIGLAGKRLGVRHAPGPQGVRGRISDNRLIWARLGWRPTRPLVDGLRPTYAWIARQVALSGTGR